MPYTLEVDDDIHFNLERLKAYYQTDEGHILRALLKERLKKIDELQTQLHTL